MTTADDQENEFIDAALQNWRQGDCALEGEHWFANRYNPTEVRETQVPGFAVLTQSCDVVRRYKRRPFVSVSALTRVTDSRFLEIQKGYYPQFAPIPGVASQKLVADLDRIMTVDKKVVAGWTRIQGCTNEREARDFSTAVARKYSRAAFPDDFNTFVARLRDRIKEKHGKTSPEGDTLRALDEIRVRAAPSWQSAEVELMFWFIANPGNAVEVRESGFVREWERLVQASGRFTKVYVQVVTHEELTAADYVESDRLDLDHLSGE